MFNEKYDGKLDPRSLRNNAAQFDQFKDKLLNKISEEEKKTGRELSLIEINDLLAKYMNDAYNNCIPGNDPVDNKSESNTVEVIDRRPLEPNYGDKHVVHGHVNSTYARLYFVPACAEDPISSARKKTDALIGFYKAGWRLRLEMPSVDEASRHVVDEVTRMYEASGGEFEAELPDGSSKDDPALGCVTMLYRNGEYYGKIIIDTQLEHTYEHAREAVNFDYKLNTNGNRRSTVRCFPDGDIQVQQEQEMEMDL